MPAYNEVSFITKLVFCTILDHKMSRLSYMIRWRHYTYFDASIAREGGVFRSYACSCLLASQQKGTACFVLILQGQRTVRCGVRGRRSGSIRRETSFPFVSPPLSTPPSIAALLVGYRSQFVFFLFQISLAAGKALHSETSSVLTIRILFLFLSNLRWR